jgi:hypothetical protein
VAACGIVLLCGTVARGAVEYPLSVTLDAVAKSATASVTSSVSVSIERVMEELPRKRAADGLTYNGYQGFMNVLRTLPPLGAITLSGRKVEIRYAHDQAHTNGRRLVLVSDQPLFFLASDPAKRRTGYELTIVELIVDEQGGINGTMAGAARVKPGADGVPILDDFAEVPVRLAGRLRN